MVFHCSQIYGLILGIISYQSWFARPCISNRLNAMPITLTQADYQTLLNEAEQSEQGIFRQSDTTLEYPTALGQGYYRNIELRQGLELSVANYQLQDDLILKLPARPHPIEYSIVASGQFKDEYATVRSGQYMVCSSGIAPSERWEMLANEPILEVNVHIEPELFCAFVGNNSETACRTMQQLVGNLQLPYLVWSGTASSVMQITAQQILHCPYQGLTKRIYLESKVWELMALLIDQLAEPHSKKPRTNSLKPDDIDRIHQAKDILLKQLDNPPSLMELARQVGLNDCTLKRGFRQVFGTTAFGYLHRYRLEQARQLLEIGDMNIAEVAQQVGFADRSYFTTAFRKQFGCNPGAYRRTYRHHRSTNSDIPFTPQKNSA
jgi:AraC-like DNA-binding protein